MQFHFGVIGVWKTFGAADYPLFILFFLTYSSSQHPVPHILWIRQDYSKSKKKLNSDRTSEPFRFPCEFCLHLTFSKQVTAIHYDINYGILQQKTGVILYFIYWPWRCVRKSQSKYKNNEQMFCWGLIKSFKQLEGFQTKEATNICQGRPNCCSVKVNLNIDLDIFGDFLYAEPVIKLT